MKRLFLLLTVPLIFGCAKPGVSKYEFIPSDINKVKHEIVLNQSFDETWDALVENLTSSFYVINNIEKSSRIINVSFSSNEPEEFIECGESIRHYERGKESQDYRYKFSESTSYKIAGKTNISSPMTTYIDRETNLEGRINIYVAPFKEKTKIKIRVQDFFRH